MIIYIFLNYHYTRIIYVPCIINFHHTFEHSRCHNSQRQIHGPTHTSQLSLEHSSCKQCASGSEVGARQPSTSRARQLLATKSCLNRVIIRARGTSATRLVSQLNIKPVARFSTGVCRASNRERTADPPNRAT